jgi:hypothetical protein
MLVISYKKAYEQTLSTPAQRGTHGLKSTSVKLEIRLYVQKYSLKPEEYISEPIVND